MPRRRRTTKKRSDQDLRMMLSNPFSALDEPWNNSAFDMAAAKRIWRQIRAEVLESWSKRYPGKQPPGAMLFEKNPKHSRKGASHGHAKNQSIASGGC